MSNDLDSVGKPLKKLGLLNPSAATGLAISDALVRTKSRAVVNVGGTHDGSNSAR
jgi:hypothetical protein